MLVIKVLIGALVLFSLYYIISRLNEKAIASFKHDFFSTNLFVLAFVSYVSIYVGHFWYVKELATNGGDPLSGALVMSFGIIGLLTILILNIKQTNILVGVLGTLIQLPLFVIGSFFAVFIIIAAIAGISQVRPVYNIND